MVSLSTRSRTSLPIRSSCLFRLAILGLASVSLTRIFFKPHPPHPKEPIAIAATDVVDASKTVLPRFTRYNGLDNETRDLCHRAYELDSKASVLDQIKFISKEGTLSSQMYQDATIISSLGRTILHGGGVYADVAAAHPRYLSNTFALDLCYGWKGLCVEADPLRVSLLKAERSCKVVDTCVSEIEGEEVEFYVTSKESDTLSNGIVSIGTANTGQKTKMRCKTMSNVFYEGNITRVDFMSLDVESAEPLVLAGIDWSQVDIEIIVMEINKHTTRTEGMPMTESAKRIIGILEAQNYLPVLELFPYHKKTMPIDDCSSVLLGQTVQSVFQPNRENDFSLGVWRRQDVLFVRKGGLYEQPIINWVHTAGC